MERSTHPSLSAQWRRVLTSAGRGEGGQGGPGDPGVLHGRSVASGAVDDRVTDGSAPDDASEVAGGGRSAVARLLRTRAEERSWLIAATGEERTADRLERLAQLDTRWRVLHGIRRGGPVLGIDHLAIGPGGVFVISSKHHRRARVWVRGNVVVVDGERQPYVRAARQEAVLAAARLRVALGAHVAVCAAVALVDARELTVTVAPPDVSVLHQRGLVRWLLRQPEVLGEGAVEELYVVARRESTWSVPEHRLPGQNEVRPPAVSG